MAKKKKQRAKYTSKGERVSVAKYTDRTERGAYEVWAAKRRAWSQGKHVRLDVSQFGGPEKSQGWEGVKKGKVGWGDPAGKRG